MGLNDAMYGPVRSGIIQQEPIPKIKQVLAMILKEDQYRRRQWPLAPTITAAAWRLLPKVSDYASPRTCSHCLKSGQKVNFCFQLLGYPEWWESNSQLATRASSSSDGAGRSRGNSRSTHGRGGGRGSATCRDNGAGILHSVFQQ